MAKARHDFNPIRGRRRIARTLRNLALLVILGAAGAGGLAAYKHNYDLTHDLSAIGNGTPTSVQIHDPNCSLCRQLRRNVDSVKDEFGDSIEFRIADIHTREGAALARRHGVPHVTLLLFDGDGELVTVLRGVRDPENLRAAFRTLIRKQM